ncbi:hypothetical protein [Synechococcus sp. CC9616]|uniref:hypothetical protein n=1 Tax=Synechococcus sp. CC9616 TaxID=110663 RepID=UPI000490C8A2|nr:hypothetical protein [Synechococcus sp. CC9616]
MSRDRSELLQVFSIVLASAALCIAWLAMRLLSQPIPIRIEGGLDVDRLVMPASLTIEAKQPLPVVGVVDVKDEVRIADDPLLSIRGPVTVREIKAPLQVNAQASVEGAVQISSPDPISVDGDVSVDGVVLIEGKVDA